MYLLDTNVCIGLLNGADRRILDAFQARRPSEIALCSVVKAELLFGARNSRRVAENLQTLAKFFAPLESLPFDDRSAEHYGAIRAELTRQGALIGANDLLIAAIARAHDATLVTHNVEEFSRVVGLQIVDWES